MNKKVSSLICFVLIVILSVPVVSVVFARETRRGPPEKIVFIHHKKGHAKPEKEDKGDYKLLVRGAKWKETPVDYFIDPDNLDGLSEAFITGAIFASAEEWDEYTGMELFGSYTIDDDCSWDGDYGDYPDGRNELLFGNYPQEGVIAVAVVWGHFGGPPSQREIIEFDIMFDTDYKWGYAGKTSETELGNIFLMDLQNIATHELGHGAGLGDLYNRKTTEETMYGYSDYGETKKRTLYAGDKAGIQELYGE